MPPTISKLMLDPNSGKSGSAISLLSTEAEQALLKVSMHYAQHNSYGNDSNKRNI